MMPRTVDDHGSIVQHIRRADKLSTPSEGARARPRAAVADRTFLKIPGIPAIIAGMTKIERIDTTLQGGEVDYPPVSLWYHFGIQHGSGDAFARTCLEFFEYYDLDWLKVMNDYFYPLPEGVETIRSREDLQRIAPFNVESCEWHHQLKALHIIGKTLEDRAYFLDTVFDPWQTLRRNLAGENLPELMETEAQALLRALEIVTDNLIAYCRLALAQGAAGIFLSIPASAEIMTRDQFLRFCKPFAAKLLASVQDLGKMNTAHIHGKQLFFEDILDLPVQVLSWYDRHPDCPSLQEAKEKFAGCVMGGIDQEIVSRRTRAFLKDHVREAIDMGGGSRLFLAGGCSIDTWVDPGSLQAIVEAARS
jgi:uroporphyrinogen decarboxylase